MALAAERFGSVDAVSFDDFSKACGDVISDAIAQGDSAATDLAPPERVAKALRKGASVG